MAVKISILFLLTVLVAGSSCNGVLDRIFTKPTPHEAYARQVKDDSLGAQWVDVSKKALITTQAIGLPYRLAGYFHGDKPRALSLRFTARQGERINFEMQKKPGHHLLLFADLYKQDGTQLSHLLAVDTANALFGFDAEETTEYVLRIQPGLHRTGEYSLSASVSPSLGYPVAGKKARAGSFWGDERDGGKRRHEGIDIFAEKRTPVLASADGYITRVAEGGIGGKTIWMRAGEHDVHLYYAHLDQQLVQERQHVKKGDTLGLVGNTGNARYTPPHLHFGIYTSEGPVDPLPFVDRVVKTAPALAAKNLESPLQLKSSFRDKTGLSKENAILLPLAMTNKHYIGELADGSLVEVPAKYVIAVKPGNALAKEPSQVNASGG